MEVMKAPAQNELSGARHRRLDPMPLNDTTSPLKTCTKCGEGKPPSEFQRSARASDGLQNHCKVCANAYRRAWAAANSDKEKEYNRRYKEKHPERVAANNRAYVVAHPK